VKLWPRCYGCHWVCETHRDRPWEGPRACAAVAPERPARFAIGAEPKMPADFVADKRVKDLH